MDKILDYISINGKKIPIILKYGQSIGKNILIGQIENSAMSTGSIGRSKDDKESQQSVLIVKQTSSSIFPLTVEGMPVKDRPVEGIDIPDIPTEYVEEKEDEDLDIKTTDMTYPLIEENGTTFASAHIYWDMRNNELRYDVIEPVLTSEEKNVLLLIKEYIQEKIDINFSQLKKADAVSYLGKIFERALNYFKIKQQKKDVFRYFIIRDFIGLEKLEPLIQDKQIEDISCDGINIPIFIYHRNSKFGSIKTSVLFETQDELDEFTNKIAERTGRSISVAKPLLDGTLPDGSRIQVTLGSDIAKRGSNFTIRLFSDKPITPADAVRNNVLDLKMMAYLWFLIERGSSVLISGGTATGKTSLLNILSLFIKPQMKIVSIEDTSELRLPHPHWISEVARTPVSEEGKIDMFELLRESLRQRPDYIIVGEVRGKEAYVLFQQMATGHPGLSTIHADSFSKLFDRLTSPPIELAPNMLENLDVIIFIKRMKREKKYLRRVSNLVEVVGYRKKYESPLMNEVISWNTKTDKFDVLSKSYMLKKYADIANMSKDDIKKDLEQRAKVLQWIINNNISDYTKIAKIINLYNTSQDFLMEKVEAS